MIRFVVSPAVSPDGLKMGRFLISWDERNNYSTRSKPVICSLLMTSAKSSQNAVFALGNPCSSVELREQRSGKNKRIEWIWVRYRCRAERFLERQASRWTLGSLLESIVARGISM